MSPKNEWPKPTRPLRVVTATALFDGHDAAINIFRRLMQTAGMEVIHLGHNRSVSEIATAAVQEDAQAVAVSAYQGGHVEFFQFLVDQLRRLGADHIKIFGGGGGVILTDEIEGLKKYGVTDIFTPEDGARLGLNGIVDRMIRAMVHPAPSNRPPSLERIGTGDWSALAGLISMLEKPPDQWPLDPDEIRAKIGRLADRRSVPVVGITGSGGAGKSSLTDELVQRLLRNHEHIRLAVVCIDPTRRKTGGALLGDRIRMNAIADDRVFVRSLATRDAEGEIPRALPDILAAVKAAGFDLILVETAGIGQGDTRIADVADVTVYVMTREFGAASQLEKIDMLDFADLVVINKFDKQGSEDALAQVRAELRRARQAQGLSEDGIAVFGTIAAKFNDEGVTTLYQALLEAIRRKTDAPFVSAAETGGPPPNAAPGMAFPARRNRYLSEIAEAVRAYHDHTRQQMQLLRRQWHLEQTLELLDRKNDTALRGRLEQELIATDGRLDPAAARLISEWGPIKEAYGREELAYPVRGETVNAPLFFLTLAQQKIPKIALPEFEDPGELYRWLRKEHLPGHYPFTAGVYPLKRTHEDPTRMFAGEGDPQRTNKRFKLLSADSPTRRISTAFDSVTLYGCDPDRRPDIYGKIGNAGVSIATLDDIKTLYEGFDLCDPATSVSMTINGPAPIVLAMLFNAAVDQQVDRFTAAHGRRPDPEEIKAITARVLTAIRGTVQADILKEDQSQNTCIFAIDFALKIMGDVQQFFITHNIRNFYSISISGYHMAEAGANPITQLAFTLANGLTYLEYFLSRGMSVDDVAPNFSFFFSNGMDPEYTVIGRVARRIWAIALREIYKAEPRSQMLKYHIQTSGRSLHVQDIHFNDIRTTLQGLCAIYDNCQSLHTNAYDEAITTPTEASVRRALAIQMIINREWGLAKNENPLQGSFIVEELTDLVEEAVVTEFERLTRRGGVLGAMETGYQRTKIQEESIYYETLKHNGKLPIIGVNTFRDPMGSQNRLSAEAAPVLARSTRDEKESQIRRLQQFQHKHAEQAPQALRRLQQAALTDGNIFEALMDAVRHCSLGQITQALFEVGGKYRRNM